MPCEGLKKQAKTRIESPIRNIIDNWPMGQAILLLVFMILGNGALGVMLYQNHNLFQMKIQEINEVRRFHDEYCQNAVIKEAIQIKIAEKVGVNKREIMKLLEKDPIFIRNCSALTEFIPGIDKELAQPQGK